jgi:hypothetical protein
MSLVLNRKPIRFNFKTTAPNTTNTMTEMAHST